MMKTDKSETACTGVILAGGLNTRFSGKNKAFIRFGGGRVIDHIYDVFRSVFDEIILVTNQPTAYVGWDLTIATDIFPVRSSLTGIHAGLFYAGTPFIFVTACDTPFLKKEMVETVVSRITSADAVVIPETAEGTEQLCAAYSKTCLPMMERQITAQKFQIKRMFNKLRVRKIPESVLRKADPELMSFFNINSAEDYLEAQMKLAQHREHPPRRRSEGAAATGRTEKEDEWI
jgi:molybdopterin-guanine dinucleotide biosynthesis protein A